MRRGRIFIYLALIIILGLVAVFVLYQRYTIPATLEAQTEVAEPTPVVEFVDVVVVTQNTPRGKILDETVLTTVQLPKNEAVEGIFFNDLAAVVGRRAKFDLDSGIPLTSSMLVESAEELSAAGSLAALLIPRGKVAVSIPISRLSSVSYAPRPGDHVSVIVTLLMVGLDSEFQSETPNQVASVLSPGLGTAAVVGSGSGGERETSGSSLSGGEATENLTLRIIGGGGFAMIGRAELDPLFNELIYVVPSEAQRPRLVSQILLPDATVLQVGDFPLEEEEPATEAIPDVTGEAAQPEPQPVPPEEPAPENEIVPPDVITLIVSPQEAVTLNYLLYSGAQLTLALRATGDDTEIATEPATLQFLLDEYNIAVPAKLPYGLEPRLDELVPPVLERDRVVPEE